MSHCLWQLRTDTPLGLHFCQPRLQYQRPHTIIVP
ncbi:hypothetical protein CGRA01v4_04910 [Colletotrichum graminicola]|nr:hypothetical protein CGRA01v4_04910 [Colletotrichum graminicola]